MDIHSYSMNIQMAKAALAKHRDGQLACAFLDHLQATGLSQGRVATYGNKLRVVLKYIDKADIVALGMMEKFNYHMKSFKWLWVGLIGGLLPTLVAQVWLTIFFR